jgi:hypothetical protein
MENRENNGDTDTGAFFMANCFWFDNMVPVYLLFPEGSA